MSRDMKRIANFFQFPFRQTKCNFDELNPDKKRDYSISRADFIKTNYKDFFGVWFMETVSKYRLSDILSSDDANGQCRYIFNYPNTFISKKNNCKTAFFSIEKVQGHYKLTSSWESP